MQRKVLYFSRLVVLLTGVLPFICGIPCASETASQEAPPGSQLIEFAAETLGAPPQAFIPVVGDWLIGQDANRHVLVVDGRRWQKGTLSAGLADKARALYGERYAEFLDNVKTYAYFPLAVARDIEDFHAGEISVRFKPIAGRIDQAAGIAFNLKPNGDYLVLRANALENNLVLFSYVHGKRSAVKWIRNTPTPTQQWHELRLVVDGTRVQGYLDGQRYLAHTLTALVSGRVGLWSKADSVVYFDNYRITPSGT